MENLIISQKGPLNLKDSSGQTYGCRHSHPDICRANSTPGVCAFARKDKICKQPPRSWKKLFARNAGVMKKLLPGKTRLI